MVKNKGDPLIAILIFFPRNSPLLTTALHSQTKRGSFLSSLTAANCHSSGAELSLNGQRSFLSSALKLLIFSFLLAGGHRSGTNRPPE